MRKVGTSSPSDHDSHTRWMRDIPDDTPVSMLSIPGTHDSCCVESFLGLAKTQNMGVADQLEAGIRFLDIRLAHYRGNLCVHHDVVCTEHSYADILNVCSEFLGQHPSEAIVMSVKNESRFDAALGSLAPSRILCPLLAEEGNSCGHEGGSFEDTLKTKTWEYIGDTPLFYNFTVAPEGGGDLSGTRSFTGTTTLGEIRGKIVLLRRFDGSQDMGMDCTYWPENQRFRSPNPPFYNVEDHYQSPEHNEKINFVVSHIEEAERGDPTELYITFSSAVDLTARGYSEIINPLLDDYLARSSPGRAGIVVMDYFDEPPHLVSNVINKNWQEPRTDKRARPPHAATPELDTAQ